jgi:hypothetical protein
MFKSLHLPFISSAFVALAALPPAAQTTDLGFTAAASGRMCSNGFEKPAFLVPTEKGWDLHIGSITERLERKMSLGTGLNGEIYASDKSDETEVIYSTEIVMFSDPSAGEDKPTILIFRDRVFWPCENFKFAPAKAAQ